MLKFVPANVDRSDCVLFHAYADSGLYSVIYTLGDDIHWSACYGHEDKYISDKLRLLGKLGYGVPTECRFETKEEAMAICERHNKLLLLQ